MPGNWKPSQLPRASEVMDLDGEPTTVTLLNQHKSELHYKYLSLYTQVTIVLTSSKRNFSL